MKTGNLAAAVVAIVFGTVLSNLNWAQNPSPDAAPLSDREVDENNLRALKVAVEAQQIAAKESAKAAAKAMKDARVQEVRFRKFLPASFGEPRHLTQISEAADRYSNSRDELQKAKALKQLHELASQFFEEDMKVRQKELQDIEARLEKLRAQLDRRRAKKDEIVELQVKVAINEAEGLGFTSAPREDFKYNVRVQAPVMFQGEPPKFDVMTAAPPSSDLLGPPVPVEIRVPSPPQPPSDPLVLGFRAKGEAVRLLQDKLNEKLEPSPNLKIDGDFGPDTEKALRAFQAAHDLEVSGVVDEATHKELGLPDEMPPFIKE
ncbi:MAG: peptidoglycan-binding protein [Pirellulales bacterium]